ncbi:SNF2 family amino-terminal protein [Rhizoctonia solani]|uniref:SNF2 family amino-terminal protein n=1 Tax=Rhizoctonia solani TaxID=456999 RepID=A0A8H8P7F7_9AGAM|nr:SNF2 family amino-terminal protein [Rhizoctonia solani]QRW26665.1 SNF2 family amino-terminal protein [Rhizoctonia solani]
MPTTPLAHTPLLFLDNPSMRLDRGPYGIRPFVNNHFRLLCGLRPIRDAEDAKPDNEDIHDSSGIPLEYATLSDGFLLTEEAYKGIPASYQRYFTKPCRELHAQYLAQAIKYASQHCKAASSSNGKSKKRGPSARKAAIQDVDDITQSCISSTAAKCISGHAQFKGAILGMYNWSNGVMGRMADLMRRTLRSPVHAWRDLAMDEPEVNPYSLTIKSSKGVLNKIITQASMELFGTCALTSSTRVPRPGYKAFVRAILERVWERELRRLNRSLVTAAETRDKCKGALETLTPDVAESPTWENLKEASVSLKKYKDLVELTGGEMDESIGKLEKSFEDVWVALGYVRADNGLIRRIKATKKAMLMTEDEMDRAYTNYVELHFPPQKEGVKELTENLANAVSLEEGVNANLLAGSEGSDIGVSEFANTSLDEMFRLLGLSLTMSIPFTSKEYKSQWHQLVAVAVQLKGMFTKQLGEQA